MPPTPLCFVLMPFGQKHDPSGATVDFDAVYRDLIAPAIETAGLKPIRAAGIGDKDCRVFELLDWLPSPGPVAHSKTDTFREQAEYSLEAKANLAAARKQGVDRLRELQRELEPLDRCEAGVLADLFLSYRAVKAWQDMIALVERMPAPVRQTTMVQEQFGFALNRAGRGEEAEACCSRSSARTTSVPRAPRGRPSARWSTSTRSAT